MWYVKLPSKLCCTHATQLSFISLSQICDSNLGALSAIQPPPLLPQWTCSCSLSLFPPTQNDVVFMKLNVHLASFARSVTLIWARYLICKTSLQAMLYSCNPAFIHFAFPDLWLQFGRVICYSTSPSLPQWTCFLQPFAFSSNPKRCSIHETQCSFG